MMTSAGHRVLSYLLRIRVGLVLLPIVALGTYYSVWHSVVNQAPGETGLSALALLHTGVIADPYLIPTGPTAHTAPGTVGLIAAVFAIFDGNTRQARIALSLLATAEYAGSAALVMLYCRAARLGLAGTAAAAVLLGVLPVHLYAAVVFYRQWDQPMSGLLLTAILLVFAVPQVIGPGKRSPMLVLAALGGLFAPVLPGVAILAQGALGWRWRAWRPALLGAGLTLASMLPWAVRNEYMLGSFILTRSNYGLELASGNNDSATGLFDLQTMPPIHPHDSLAAVQHLAAVGEVAYMVEMRERAMTWIKAHPARFAALSLRRAKLLFFPDAAGGDPVFGRAKPFIIWATSIMAAAALILVWIRCQPMLPWLVCVGLPLAPYVFTHVSERYSFPTYFVIVCLVATGVDAVALASYKRRDGVLLPASVTNAS